jgi:site-specific recombinase XerD
LKRAGIENFRWHDLRHTWASWHRQSGTPTHELQRLGGWRSSVMVERYAHLAPDHLAKLPIGSTRCSVVTMWLRQSNNKRQNFPPIL